MPALPHRWFAFAAAVCLSTPAAASRFGGLLGGGGPPSNSASYSFRTLGSSEHTDGASAITDHRADASFVVARTSDTMWSVQQSVRQFHVTGAPMIRERGFRVPGDLWDVQTGFTYRRKVDERRDVTVVASAGSASDKPYDSLHEMTGRLTALYRFPARGRDSWVAALTYSNDRTFLNNIPLPGFAYVTQAEDRRWTAVLGFPFAAVSYEWPTRTSTSFSIFGPRDVSVEIVQPIRGPIKAYSEFVWGQDQWLRSGRNDVRNRLVYDEKHVALGMRTPLVRGVLLDLSGGQAFDRRFFENRDSSAKDVPRASLANHWFVMAQLKFRWAVGAPL